MSNPCKYFSHVEPYLKEIKALRQKGESERNIAKKLKVSWGAFLRYKKQFPEFEEVLKESKELLVAELKKSVWKEAMGYYVEEQTKEIEETFIYSADGKKIITGGKEKKKIVKKYQRGNSALLMYSLCNLIPGEFQRVDKEAIDELKEELIKNASKDIITDNRIKNAFDCLYGEAINKKNEALKKLEEAEKGGNKKNEL